MDADHAVVLELADAEADLPLLPGEEAPDDLLDLADDALVDL